MSIKSVTNPSCPKPTIGFPKLMRTEKGTIALFLSAGGAGIVLKCADGSTAWEVGHLYYASSFAMGLWSDFEGTLVLSNEP